MVTVFLSNLNEMDFHLVQNRKENCHHDHIPFNVKGNGNIVFSVCVSARTCVHVQAEAQNVLFVLWFVLRFVHPVVL